MTSFGSSFENSQRVRGGNWPWVNLPGRPPANAAGHGRSACAVDCSDSISLRRSWKRGPSVEVISLDQVATSLSSSNRLSTSGARSEFPFGHQPQVTFDPHQRAGNRVGQVKRQRQRHRHQDQEAACQPE